MRGDAYTSERIALQDSVKMDKGERERERWHERADCGRCSSADPGQYLEKQQRYRIPGQGRADLERLRTRVSHEPCLRITITLTMNKSKDMAKVGLRPYWMVVRLCVSSDWFPTNLVRQRSPEERADTKPDHAPTDEQLGNDGVESEFRLELLREGGLDNRCGSPAHCNRAVRECSGQSTQQHPHHANMKRH